MCVCLYMCVHDEDMCVHDVNRIYIFKVIESSSDPKLEQHNNY